MKWKRSLLALSVAAIVVLLVATIAVVFRPGADNTELAGSTAGAVPSSPAPATGVPTASSAPGDADTLAARPKPKKPLASLDFVLSSFNVLGSSHTAPGGTRASMPPGQARIRWAARLLARHGVDVVGFQELQLDQARAFIRANGGTYDVFPGTRLGGKGAQNSIAWRTDMWELVDANTLQIPYFDGNRMPMPVVLLRNRETGLSAYFSNFHNPASTPRHPNQGRWRRLAATLEVALVNRLTRQTDYPVFLTGAAISGNRSRRSRAGPGSTLVESTT